MKPAPPVPDWLNTATFYEIYPQSFLDTNGDGIGDLPGIISKLDYIASLGANALWLNPVFESPFGDAGYDVSDFRKVAPRYGTNADLKRLFKEAHKRGMRVVLDLVAGHTSVEHPWFKASRKHQPNPHSDYFTWTPNVWTEGGPGRWINGAGPRDGNYLANFFWFQPALNYGYANPDPSRPWEQPVDAPAPSAVRAELEAIMRFWLDAGCDGFRVDMAASLVKGPPDSPELRSLWRDIRGWMGRDYSHAVLISEWSNPKQALSAGFDVGLVRAEPSGGLAGRATGDDGHGQRLRFSRHKALTRKPLRLASVLVDKGHTMLVCDDECYIMGIATWIKGMFLEVFRQEAERAPWENTMRAYTE